MPAVAGRIGMRHRLQICLLLHDVPGHGTDFKQRYIARQTGYILRTHPRRSIIIADRQGIVQYV